MLSLAERIDVGEICLALHPIKGLKGAKSTSPVSWIARVVISQSFSLCAQLEASWLLNCCNSLISARKQMPAFSRNFPNYYFKISAEFLLSYRFCRYMCDEDCWGCMVDAFSFDTPLYFHP